MDKSRIRPKINEIRILGICISKLIRWKFDLSCQNRVLKIHIENFDKFWMFDLSISLSISIKVQICWHSIWFSTSPWNFGTISIKTIVRFVWNEFVKVWKIFLDFHSRVLKWWWKVSNNKDQDIGVSFTSSLILFSIERINQNTNITNNGHEVCNDICWECSDHLNWIREDASPFDNSITIMSQSSTICKLNWKSNNKSNTFLSSKEDGVNINITCESIHDVCNIRGNLIWGLNACLKLGKLIFL